MTKEYEGETVRSCYHTRFTRTDYNAGLPDESKTPMGSGTYKFTDYTELDERIDNKANPNPEKEVRPAKMFLNDYSPFHDYKWAVTKASEGEHCVCDELLAQKLRLVYALNILTLRRYDKCGITIETLEPTEEAINSKTWRLWNGE